MPLIRSYYRRITRQLTSTTWFAVLSRTPALTLAGCGVNIFGHGNKFGGNTTELEMSIRNIGLIKGEIDKNSDSNMPSRFFSTVTP
jgi:hypothetical protein